MTKLESKYSLVLILSFNYFNKFQFDILSNITTFRAYT